MKILVLTPLHEISEYSCLELMVELQRRGVDVISLPSYANYLKEVGIAKNVEQSIFMSLVTAKQYVATHTNCVIIGNCDRSQTFDIIVGVNPFHEEGETIQDLQVAKLKELYGADEQLGPIINNLYTTADQEYSMGASAGAISDFICNVYDAYVKRNKEKFTTA